MVSGKKLKGKEIFCIARNLSFCSDSSHAALVLALWYSTKVTVPAWVNGISLISRIFMIMTCLNHRKLKHSHSITVTTGEVYKTSSSSVIEVKSKTFINAVRKENSDKEKQYM